MTDTSTTNRNIRNEALEEAAKAVAAAAPRDRIDEYWKSRRDAAVVIRALKT